MTQSELIAALPQGRLPADLLDLGLAELIVLFGLGLVLAALVSMLALPFAAWKPSLRAQIRATGGMPAQERALAVARILGHLPPALHSTAYRGEPIADDAFERIALAGKRGRR